MTNVDFSAIRPQGPPPLVLAAILGPPFLLLVATVAVCLHTGVEPDFFVRDPASLTGTHSLMGSLSHLGVLVWWAGGSICLFGYVWLRRRGERGDGVSFLLFFSLLTVVLALDDLYRFHDDLVTRYLGLRQRWVFAAYGLASAWGLYRFRAVILRSELVLLAIGFAFFGLSLFVDGKLYFHPFKHGWLSRWSILLEDGAKLLGIAAWSAYLIRATYAAVSAHVDVARASRRSGARASPPEPTLPVRAPLPPTLVAEAVTAAVTGGRPASTTPAAGAAPTERRGHS